MHLRLFHPYQDLCLTHSNCQRIKYLIPTENVMTLLRHYSLTKIYSYWQVFIQFNTVYWFYGAGLLGKKRRVLRGIGPETRTAGILAF